MLTEIIYALGKQCGEIIAKSIDHIWATCFGVAVSVASGLFQWQGVSVLLYPALCPSIHTNY